MLESLIERHLCRRAKKAGGEVIKLPVRERRGRPDRLLLLPKYRMFFVELKAPGKKPEKHQAREHKRLLRMGFPVLVLDTKRDVDRFMDSL